MLYKKVITLLLISLCLTGYSQRPLTEYSTDEVFNGDGEIYFILKDAATQADKLTHIISIDNVKNGDIFAYASVKEFEELRSLYNFTFYQLPKPSELMEVEMSGSTRDVLDWNYYPTYTGYLQIMQDFATNFPNICEIDTIGLTVEDRLLLAARISDNVGMEENEPEFLYTSSIHGDETTGYILTLHLIDYLLQNYGIDQRITNMVNNIDIWINPLANPDGTYAGGNNTVNGATRFNANNVDMNRNYPDPEDGPHPDGNSWQPETIAFMEFAENRDFTMSANFHGGAEVVNYPWDTWIHPSADDAWWQFVSREYADTVHANAPNGYMDDLNNGITNGYAWYRITGGRQDYMNYFQQCREVTIELSNTKLLPTNQLINYWNYNYRSMLNYIEQTLYGVRGVVTDTITGEPLNAQVYISGHDEDSSMVFTSMPIGNYYRFLKAGTYKITFFGEGYPPKTYRNVVVNDKQPTVLNVRLWNGTPIPSFTSSDTLIEPGESVQFYDQSGGTPNSWLWTFEGGTPATSTDPQPTVTYTQEGSFSVTLEVSNMAGSNTITIDDYITVDDGIGINETDLKAFTIYPNPVIGRQVLVKSKTELIKYVITDINGKALATGKLSGTDALIDLSSLGNGLFILKLQNSKDTGSYKIILEN
ncbi:MAG TPA: M14 family zinc carboxypeptidase [Lentimicrobium sp.]|nr:M14 family zinc carboxypeptidase [Lentimicrobium sp.]